MYYMTLPLRMDLIDCKVSPHNNVLAFIYADGTPFERQTIIMCDNDLSGCATCILCLTVEYGCLPCRFDS